MSSKDSRWDYLFPSSDAEAEFELASHLVPEEKRKEICGVSGSYEEFVEAAKQLDWNEGIGDESIEAQEQEIHQKIDQLTDLLSWASDEEREAIEAQIQTYRDQLAG